MSAQIVASCSPDLSMAAQDRPAVTSVALMRASGCCTVGVGKLSLTGKPTGPSDRGLWVKREESESVSVQCKYNLYFLLSSPLVHLLQDQNNLFLGETYFG